MGSIKHAVLETETCRSVLSRLSRSASGERLRQHLGRRHGVFASFDAAWAAAADGRHAGHDHPDATRYLLELSQALRPSDYAALYWLKRLTKPLRLVDFGGNVGNLYYSYLPYLETIPGTAVQSWTTHDLPVVLEQGRRLAHAKRTTSLHFAEDLDRIGPFEVLLVSGALHYWEQDIAALLSRFNHRPTYVLVNRSPVHDSEPDFITIQRHDAYAVPCKVRNRESLIREFEQNGYRLVDHWRALELSIRMPLFPEKSVPFYSGFLFGDHDTESRLPA